jgi:hypothetical protein
MPNRAEPNAATPEAVLPSARPEVSDRAAEGTPSGGEELPTREIGGPTGPEPTRFGDWEKKGRCIDF